MQKYQINFPEEMQGMSVPEKIRCVSDHAAPYSALQQFFDAEGNMYCVVVSGSLDCPYATYLEDVEVEE